MDMERSCGDVNGSITKAINTDFDDFACRRPSSGGKFYHQIIFILMSNQPRPVRLAIGSSKEDGDYNSMKNLFQANAAEEIERRIAALKPDGHPLWGTMNVAQMVAHCSAGLELASGDRRPPRALIGRLIGWAIKPMVLKNDDPMRRNSPTVEGLVVRDKRDLEIERKRLSGLIDRFVAAGSSGCTKHPHSFFGQLTPDEWAILMYKHLDHHLRQFGV
jgi:hypothetical protein